MALEAVGAGELVGLDGLGGLGQRLERGSQRGERLLATLAQALLARGGAQGIGVGLGLGDGGHDGVRARRSRRSVGEC